MHKWRLVDDMACWSASDKLFMRRCLLLAQKGEGKVSPNPLVGAVVVKNNLKISEGFHEKFGSPHAEANALRGIDARGATLYISLEPCSHLNKKTPPCVPLIIRSGISRVVIAAKDPNPKVNGRGIKQLRASGIKVETGLFAREAEEQNASFFKYMKTGKPFVVLKMAQSRNGKIGIAGKSNVRISNKQFDKYAQKLRNRYDAILVGIGTVVADNPRLTCRMEGSRNPIRIVVDSALSIPLTANVLKNAKRERVIIATSEKRNRRKEASLKKMGVTVIICGKNEVNIPQLLSFLPKTGIISVLVEGGAQIAAEFMRLHAIDKAIVCVSQKKITAPDAISSPFTQKILSGLKNIKKCSMGRDTVIESNVDMPHVF